MVKRILILCLLLCFIMIPMLSSAADWMIFTPKQKNDYTWFYDRQSIVYLKDQTFIGITLPMKDHNYQKIWIKAVSDRVEKRYQIELNCKDRISKIFDDNGKGIYNLPDIDYLYERPIPPDTPLDMLRRAVCR